MTDTHSVDNSQQKAKLMAEIKRTKKFFYGTVVAQAQRIEFRADQLVFAFTPAQKTLADQLTQNRVWLEGTIEKVLGRKLKVMSEQCKAEWKDERVTTQTPDEETWAEVMHGATDALGTLQARFHGDPNLSLAALGLAISYLLAITHAPEARRRAFLDAVNERVADAAATLRHISDTVH